MAAATDYPTIASPSDGPSGNATYNLGSPTGLSAPMTAATGGVENDATAASDPIAGLGSPTSPKQTAGSTELPKPVQDVLQSEIGIVTMLGRLKQSVATAKEFSLFLKKRAQLEEEYSSGMRKLARTTQDNVARSQDTFGTAFTEMMDIHTRMADNGYQFSVSLHQMHEDLLELAAMAEKSRKGWKQTGLAAEQRIVDLEAGTRKSKAKYDSLAEEYDRVRTGDVGGRRAGFGFKGHKSAAQHEEDLLRKLHGADEDYHNRVDTLSRERAELLATGRPEIIKALQDIVRECDGGVVLQVQKYASFSEKLLLSNGLSISPIKSAQKPDVRSLREVVISVDTEKDLNHYISTFHSKVPPKTGDPKYERHPVLGGASSQPPASSPSVSRTHTSSQSVSQPTGLSQTSYTDTLQSSVTATPTPYGSTSAFAARGPQTLGPAPSSSHQHERSFSYSSAFGQNSRSSQGTTAQPPLLPQSPPPQPHNSLPSVGTPTTSGPSTESPSVFTPAPLAATQSSRYYSNNNNNSPAVSPYSASAIDGPPQLGALPFQTKGSAPPPAVAPPLTSTMLNAPQLPQPLVQQQPQPQPQQQLQQQLQLQQQPSPMLPHLSAPIGGGAPSKPVFGVSLETLYDRDGLAVPMVVYQCIQAVDLFGLTVEGIYRLSGSLPHVNKLKSMFDTDTTSPKLDFRNPENFFHDVNSVAGLLKQFFRDLPDPLLTREHYDRFVLAAQHDDDTVRRDSLHAVINDLPDPNYATLRALVLHLNRVVENVSVTRMTSQNLAIVFGPTLMGAGAIDAEKGRWHVRVIDTILQNTYQIFDED